MPQITAIEPQKRKSGRFNIYIDGEFSAGVNELILVQHNLKIGQILSEDEISKILLKEESSKLMDKTLRFLAVRPRSEKEVFDYLVKKVATDQNIKYDRARESLVIKEIIKKLKKYRYLNDKEFAKWWLKSRTKFNPKGVRILRAELVQKGVVQDTIDSAINRLPSQLILAQKIIEKKLTRWHKLPNLQLKKKIYQYLTSRGFDFEIIRSVFAKLEKRR